MEKVECPKPKRGRGCLDIEEISPSETVLDFPAIYLKMIEKRYIYIVAGTLWFMMNVDCSVSADDPDKPDKNWIGINRILSNRLVEYFFETHQLDEIVSDYTEIRREVSLGILKLDFLVGDTYLEVKTPLTTLQVKYGSSIKTKPVTPFSSTDRFVKYINELAGSLKEHERTSPGMNGGTGEMTAKMYMSEKGKIIPCTIHKGGSIGLHTQSTGDDINYVISGTGKAICDGVEEELAAGVCHICPKGSEHSIINTGEDDLVLITIVVER